MAGKRIIIIGGGFGGLTAARALRQDDVVLIDRTNHHLFQPLLYQVATAALSPSDIAWPLRTVFRSQRNVRVLMEEVIAIDRRAGPFACARVHRCPSTSLSSLPGPGTRTLVMTNGSPLRRGSRR